MNINLIERNRLRGWIAILREGKGFLEPNKTTGYSEAIAFSTNGFTGDGTQADLGDEVEFSLRKSSGRLVAENILKVPSTIQQFYVRISIEEEILDLSSSLFSRQHIMVVWSLLFE